MENKIEWKVSRFEELTAEELYSILHLRCQIFILEQDAPYQDMDYKDQKALHLQGYVRDKMVAYCRLFKAGDYFDVASIGRVVVAKEYRKFGYGHQLMQQAVELERSMLNETRIQLSAQAYLQRFYESHGFVRTSDVYLEDGLPHIKMVKES